MDQVRETIAAIVQPGHFFLGRDFELAWEHLPRAEVAWEIFRGRLLEPAHARNTRAFEAWNIYQVDGGNRSEEPLLSLKLDLLARELHITRGILCHVWEGYDAGDNVILSRETTRWVRELSATIFLPTFPDQEDLREEIAGRLFQAVVGTSRLPLTSVEAPLPAFALGRLLFLDLPSERSSPMRSFAELIETGLAADLSALESAKLLETVLRTVDVSEVADAARLFAQHWDKHSRVPATIPALLRTLFNEVSLSPYTAFVDNALAFVHALVLQEYLSREDHVDFLAYLLRQLGRHLTAYDLIAFHHRGANYPDALLLDASLKAYLALIEERPDVFSAQASRQRRRALRQGCLLRRFYEGHPVPDAPTSPGENARVLPPPYLRVPEEQVLQPARRKKHLYEGDPLSGLVEEKARALLQQSFDDLDQPSELRELGMAVFIDRPFGCHKAPGEPDQTPLLSHEAFSQSVALRRLGEIERLALEMRLTLSRPELQEKLHQLHVPGLSLDRVFCADRQLVSLASARRVAEDFILLRTLPGSVQKLFDLYDWKGLPETPSLDFLDWPTQDLLLVPIADAAGNNDIVLAVFDATLAMRIELVVAKNARFMTRGGIELPVAGLRVCNAAPPAPSPPALPDKRPFR